MQQKEYVNENEVKAVMQAFVSDLSDLNKPAKAHPKWVEEYDKGLICGHWEQSK